MYGFQCQLNVFSVKKKQQELDEEASLQSYKTLNLLVFHISFHVNEYIFYPRNQHAKHFLTLKKKALLFQKLIQTTKLYSLFKFSSLKMNFFWWSFLVTSRFYRLQIVLSINKVQSSIIFSILGVIVYSDFLLVLKFCSMQSENKKSMFNFAHYTF